MSADLPETRLVLRTAKCPFPMQTTCTREAGAGSPVPPYAVAASPTASPARMSAAERRTESAAWSSVSVCD